MWNDQPSTLAHHDFVASGSWLTSSVCVTTPLRLAGAAARGARRARAAGFFFAARARFGAAFFFFFEFDFALRDFLAAMRSSVGRGCDRDATATGPCDGAS